MKRIACFVLAILLILPCVPIVGAAAGVEEETNITYFEDGSYIIETIQVIDCRASGTKTGTKAKTGYGSDGSAEWKATLTGTFTYTGTSATCTDSSVSVTIYDSNWYTVSKPVRLFRRAFGVGQG